MMEIAENLHRAELTAIERAEQVAEYARLAKEKREKGISAQVGQKLKSDTNPKGAGRPENGHSAAARDLGLTRQEVQRSEAIAAIAPEAKAAAIEAGLGDNQSESPDRRQ